MRVPIDEPSQVFSLRHNLKRLSHGLEVNGLLSLELVTNVFEAAHRIFRVQSFAAMQTNISFNMNQGGVISAAKQFHDLLMR